MKSLTFCRLLNEIGFPLEIIPLGVWLGAFRTYEFSEGLGPDGYKASSQGKHGLSQEANPTVSHFLRLP